MSANILILEDQPKGLALIKTVVARTFDDYHLTCLRSIKELIKTNIQHIDFAFIDLRLPDGMSFEQIQRFKDTNPTSPAIVTTLYDDDEMVFRAIQAGADGYLLKSDGVEQLTICLERIIRGEPPISPQIARKLMNKFVQLQPQEKSVHNAHMDNPNHTFLKVDNLTNREKDVLSLIGQGYMTKQVAAELEISSFRVNDIIKSIYKKLNINSRAEAALYATHNGLI